MKLGSTVLPIWRLKLQIWKTGSKGKLAASQHAEQRDYRSESQVASINLSRHMHDHACIVIHVNCSMNMIIVNTLDHFFDLYQGSDI